MYGGNEQDLFRVSVRLCRRIDVIAKLGLRRPRLG